MLNNMLGCVFWHVLRFFVFFNRGEAMQKATMEAADKVLDQGNDALIKRDKRNGKEKVYSIKLEYIHEPKTKG